MVRGKWRQLYLNNNKNVEKNNKGGKKEKSILKKALKG